MPAVEAAHSAHEGDAGSDETTESAGDSDRSREEGHTSSTLVGLVPETNVAHDARLAVRRRPARSGVATYEETGFSDTDEDTTNDQTGISRYGSSTDGD